MTGARVAAATFTIALTGLWLAAYLDNRMAGVAVLVVWGGAFSLIAVSSSLAVLRRARGPQAETATALHGNIFQIGIVAGSALGSACYAAGLLSAVPLAAAVGGLAALTVLAFAGRAFRAGPMG